MAVSENLLKRLWNNHKNIYGKDITNHGETHAELLKFELSVFTLCNYCITKIQNATKLLPKANRNNPWFICSATGKHILLKFFAFHI